MIRVQAEDFDPGVETARLSEGSESIGGVCCFTGLVRDIHGGEAIEAMTLEHYPGMTETALADIEAQARERWPLDEVSIIHRFGRLEPGERIVFVGASSAHRDAAFDACRFLIDWLKTQAPFWKKEETPEGERWVEAKDSDDVAALKWAKD